MFHNEENEWLGRVKRHEGKLLYDPKFIVHHHRRATIKKFFRQIFNWGHGRGEHIIIEPKNFKAIFLVPMTFVFYLISLIFFRPLWYLAPLGLYILLNIFFTIQIAVKHKNFKSIFVSPWLIFAIHVLYGIGIPLGLTRRSIKPRHVPHYDPQKFQIIKITL